ncbi:MAG: amidase family protein, partial [Pseudomonadota bacterium]
MDNYTDYDATGLAELVRNGDVSASELLSEAVTRATAAQQDLNCFSAMFPEVGEGQISDGLPEGPFSGVPMAVKDLGFEIEDQPITNGSLAFKGNIATRNSVLTEQRKSGGLIALGQN